MCMVTWVMEFKFYIARMRIPIMHIAPRRILTKKVLVQLHRGGMHFGFRNRITIT